MRVSAKANEVREPKLNVLIVDDHEDTVEALTEWFRQQGYAPIGTTNLNEVTPLLTKQRIDVLVIDLLFPGGDTTREIRRIRGLFPGLQIIVMSGTSDFHMTLRAIDSGADSYVTKPVDWDALERLLDRGRVA